MVCQAEWRTYNRTVPCECKALACKNNIVAASDNCEIIILDATTGSQAAIFSGHLHTITCLAFSMDGTLLVSGSMDKTVRLWDVQTGGVIKSFDCTSEVESVSISADNTTIAIGSKNNTIWLLNIEIGECHNVKGTGTSSKPVVCFSPTNPQLLLSTFGNNNTMWWWGVDGYCIGLPIISDYISFSSDGSQFVSCHGEDVIVQSTISGEVVAKFYKHGGIFSKCCFSPDKKLIACTSCDMIYLLANTGSYSLKLVRSLIGREGFIASIVFSSHCTLISADDDGIKFWEISDSLSNPIILVTKSIQSAPTPIRAVSMQSKDGLAFSIDSDGLVKSWDIFTGHCVKALKTRATAIQQGDMQLISDRLIIVGIINTLQGEVYIWDAEGARSLQVISCVKFVRMAGDGSNFFHLSYVEGGSSIQAQSLWTGEPMGKTVLEEGAEAFDPLYLDGLKVAVLGKHTQVLDFGTQGIIPVKLPPMASDRLYPELVTRFDKVTQRFKVGIEDKGTKKVFPLPDRYTYASAIQWDGQYVIVGYESGETLILDLNPITN